MAMYMHIYTHVSMCVCAYVMAPEGARVGHCGADSCVLSGSVPATRHHN